MRKSEFKIKTERTEDQTTTIKYLDVIAEDWSDIHEQIAEIDEDYTDGDEVAAAIQAGMNPDDHYRIEEDRDGRYRVTIRN